jgi:hypothetical protein
MNITRWEPFREFKDAVLRVRIPKTQAVKPKSISIEVK